MTEKNKIVTKDKSQNAAYKAKHVARILAIQSLYAYNIQTDNNDLKLLSERILSSYKNRELIDDFSVHTIEKFENADEVLFKYIITEFLNSNLNQEDIIIKYLKPGWTIDKLSIIIRAILTLAVFEIQYFGDIPYRVIIDEYVTITKLFYEKNEIGFVNGILDSIARELRPEIES